MRMVGHAPCGIGDEMARVQIYTNGPNRNLIWIKIVVDHGVKGMVIRCTFNSVSFVASVSELIDRRVRAVMLTDKNVRYIIF